MSGNRALEDWDLQTALDIAAQSKGYWHPTGFMSYEVGLWSGRRTRVHIWPAGGRRSPPNHPTYHTHMWSFRAQVLTGTYVEERIGIVPDPRGDLVQYEVQYVEPFPSAVVRRTEGRHSLTEVELASYYSGTVHELMAGEWHRTTIDEDETVVTVMAIGEAEIDRAYLAGPPGYVDGIRDRPECLDYELSRVAHSLGLRIDGHLDPLESTTRVGDEVRLQPVDGPASVTSQKT